MGVVDRLDERLDLASLGHSIFAHPSRNLQRISLDASDQGVGERVRLGAGVERLDDDNLLRYQLDKSYKRQPWPSVRSLGCRRWLLRVRAGSLPFVQHIDLE